MTTPIDDRRHLLTVIAYMRAAPGKRDKLRQALEVHIEPTGREKGYINYDLQQSPLPARAGRGIDCRHTRRATPGGTP